MKEIIADIKPQYLDHFKSQLIQYEVMGSDVNILYDGGGHQDRHGLMTDLVKRSFEDQPVSRTTSFWVFTGDNRPTNTVNGQPLFSISGPRISSDFVIPDPHIIKWVQAGVEDFHTYCEKIRSSSQTHPARMSAVWRGLTSQNIIRDSIVEAFKDRGDIFDLRDVQPDTASSNFIQMSSLPEWAILVDMPGHGFSGRLKYLLHAYRPIIVFERLDWDAITMHLEPGVHYLSCPPDTQIFDYLVRKTLSSYESSLQLSYQTVQLMKSITSRKYVSQLLVKKVTAAV